MHLILHGQLLSGFFFLSSVDAALFQQVRSGTPPVAPPVTKHFPLISMTMLANPHQHDTKFMMQKSKP